MLKFKTLSVQNFSSIGDNTQYVDFQNEGLTLILGENLDTANDIDIGRNGCGKSSLLNALSFVLYGLPLINDIKLNNLINNVNQKNMEVTIEFEKKGQRYRIERGRKPFFLRFFINDHLKDAKNNNEAQGENKQTQIEIDKVLGLSHNLFRNIITLSTRTIPFLKESKNNQRKFIEELLGIDKLTDKANSLKILKRLAKQELDIEKTKVSEKEFSNKRILDTIQSLERKSRLFEKNKQTKIDDLCSAIESLNAINIDNEIMQHETLKIYKDSNKSLKGVNYSYNNIMRAIETSSNQITEIEKKLKTTDSKHCPTCDQELHTDNHERIIMNYNKQLINLHEEIKKDKPEQQRLEEEINNLKLILKEFEEKPVTYYDTITEAYEHRSNIDIFSKELINLEAQKDPYEDQVAELKNKSLQIISYDDIEELTKLNEHQEFLYKLLTDKESVIRKRILEQNLKFLNQRLNKYLEKLGFEQEIRFLNDMSIEILARGQELGFSQLSGGEQTRVVLALSWSFRDIYELLNDPVDLILIDELLDSGLDQQGVESSMSIIKEMARKRKKEVFVISHREELVSKIGNVLKVIKEEGFTYLKLEKDYFE